MRHLVTALLAVHGLLHLPGFLKAWNLAALPQLTGRTLVPLTPGTARAAGVLWLAVAMAFVAGAGMRMLHRDTWGGLALLAIAVSQVLVVLHWHDAWAGTIPNMLLAVVALIAACTAGFHRDNRQQAQALLASAATSPSPVLRADEIAGLPPPVRRWLDASGVVGQPRARTVRLRQGGGLRTAPDQAYMPVSALQYFTVDEPGFVWTVDVTMMKVVPVVGRDTYRNGMGRMLIKAGGLVTVADGTGPTFDQGTALRFLGEIIWFPSAALAPYITWEPVDDRRARATLSHKGQRVSAEFEFDDRGRFVSLSADRYYGGESLERWVIPATEWKRIRGIEMPVRGGAVWKLASGDFDYFQWSILDVETNHPALWDAPAGR